MQSALLTYLCSCMMDDFWKDLQQPIVIQLHYFCLLCQSLLVFTSEFAEGKSSQSSSGSSALLLCLEMGEAHSGICKGW